MSDSYMIDQSKWAKLDIFNQMGNIYSEVGRSFKSQRQEDREAAIARAIDLFDATALALDKTQPARAREVLRAKEQFLEVVGNRHASQESIQSLDRYFSQFAIAARLNR